MNAGGMPKTCKSNERAQGDRKKWKVLALEMESFRIGISLEWQTGE